MIRYLTLLTCALTATLAVEPVTTFSNLDGGAKRPVVREGVPFNAKVTVRNPYDRAIRIVDKDSTCVCNILELDTEFLLPGQSTILTLETPTAGKSGNKDQRIWLFSSDPDYDPLVVTYSWTVAPMVTVDSIPTGSPPDQRPEQVAFQDVGELVAHERPDELHRLQENILVSSPKSEWPEGGFKVTGVDYEGSIWKFVIREMGPGKWLVAARAKDTEAKIDPGEYNEAFTIRTNHPEEGSIPMVIKTAIDPKAGQVTNPFAQ